MSLEHPLPDAPEPEQPVELPHPVDWEAIEAEARRKRCTVADVIYARAGRR